MKTWAALCVAFLTGWPMAAPAQATRTVPLAVPFVLAAGTAGNEGLVRIDNRSDRAGTVRITAIDDTGERFGPVTLTLGARGAVNFRSRHLEQGNASKGLPVGVGDGEGDWRLELTTGLDVVSYAYVRTAEGFVSPMYDKVIVSEGKSARIPFFNPGSNTRRVSLLRLINPGSEAAEVALLAIDDEGTEGGPVRLTLPAGVSRTLTAQDLEAGGDDFEGSFGDGKGKWRLSVTSNVPIAVMNLLRSPSGLLGSLTKAGGGSLLLAADNSGLDGLVRIDNRTAQSGTVRLFGLDDTGRRRGPATLTIDAGAAVTLSSRDIEQGNASKGLPDGIGDGTGAWSLVYDSPDDLDIHLSTYIRAADGFLMAVTGYAPLNDVGYFSPGSNIRQISRLRLTPIRSGSPRVYERDDVTVEARDDAGDEGGTVRLTLSEGSNPATPWRTLTAQDLEAGGDGFEGSFGDGEGKWRLSVRGGWERDFYRYRIGGGVRVKSLLVSPETGHLSDLSSAPDDHGDDPTTAAVFEVPFSTEGRLETGGDVDYFCFNAPREVLRVESPDTRSDTVVTLFRGNDVVNVDDDESSRSLLYAVNTQAGSRWCVQITNPEHSDAYTLRVENHSATNVVVPDPPVVNENTHKVPLITRRVYESGEVHYNCFDVPRRGVFFVNVGIGEPDNSEITIDRSSGRILIGYYGNRPGEYQASRALPYFSPEGIAVNNRAGNRWCLRLEAEHVRMNSFSGEAPYYWISIRSYPARIVRVPSETYIRRTAIRFGDDGYGEIGLRRERDSRHNVCFYTPEGGAFRIWTTASASSDTHGSNGLLLERSGLSSDVDHNSGPGNHFGFTVRGAEADSFWCVRVSPSTETRRFDDRYEDRHNYTLHIRKDDVDTLRVGGVAGVTP